MRHLLGFATGFILMAALAFSESAAPIARVPNALEMHGVWYSRDVYLPLYIDAELLEYLASIPSGGILLPVYSPVPLHFRRGAIIFVSTGLILRSGAERDLLNAIVRDGGGPLPPPNAVRFHDLQSKLAAQIADYTEATRPKLRRR